MHTCHLLRSQMNWSFMELKRAPRGVCPKSRHSPVSDLDEWCFGCALFCRGDVCRARMWVFFSPLGIYWAHIALLFTCWYIYTLYSHWVLKYVVWRYQAIVWQNLSSECLQAGKALSHRVKKWLSKHVKTWYVCCGHPSRSGIILIMGTNYIHLCASINGLMAIPQYIQSNFGLGSRMNSEVHNDTAPDSGGGVSAFELGQQSERPKSWYTKRTCIMHNFGPCMAYMIPSRNSACRQIGPIMTHPIQTITHLKNRIPSFDV